MKELVERVNSVEVRFDKKAGEAITSSLTVSASGLAPTGGWTENELRTVIKGLSFDGFLELEFVGTRPTGPANQSLTPINGQYQQATNPEFQALFNGVRISARANALEYHWHFVKNFKQDVQDVPMFAVFYNAVSFGRYSYLIASGWCYESNYQPSLKLLADGYYGLVWTAVDHKSDKVERTPFLISTPIEGNPRSINVQDGLGKYHVQVIGIMPTTSSKNEAGAWIESGPKSTSREDV